MTRTVPTGRALRGGLSATVLALLLGAQPLANSLHFLAVDHGAVTEDGTLGHGHARGHAHAHAHAHAHGCEGEERSGAFDADAPDAVASCGYLEMILRGDEGAEVRSDPAGHVTLLVYSEHRPSNHDAPPPSDPLPSAPKHSPPAA